MGLKLLPNADGIDYWIQMFQERWYEYAKDTWGVTDDTYNCFGRAYRNKTADEGYIPEFYDPEIPGYTGSSGLAVNGGLFFQNTLAAMSFFAIEDPINVVQGQSEVKVQMLFFVDLSKITPGGIQPGNNPGQQQGQRLDEVCTNDVKNFVQLNGSGLTVIKEYRDIDKVLERYSGEIKKRALLDDMHPKFCFRIDCLLHYNTYLNT